MAKKKPHNPLEGKRPDIVIGLNEQHSDEQISIIVVHKDTPEYLNICLQSITATSLNNNFELIVVDNGSTNKDSVDFLDDLEEDGECKVVRNKENLWWAKAANQGAKAANPHSKYLVFMHADCVVTNPTWLDSMIQVSTTTDAGQVGLEMHSYMLDNQKIDFIEEWCMMVTKECWKDCGPFPEELPMVGAPFLFTVSSQMSDYKPQVINTNLVHHYRVFGLDVNEFERFCEVAQITIPRLMVNLQKKKLK